MTTRDPRSRDLPTPTSPGADGVREPTQSLSVGPDDHEAAVLALGTHNRPVTAIESPGARGKTPLPPPPRIRRADDPADYVDSVLGSYRVVELLGKGGMGYVYRAEHVKLGREVALKLLRNDYASRRDAVSRFFQEARTVNRVRHRNIVDVTDFVELDDGTTYIVMELLTGTSLGAWAAGGVDMTRAIAVLVQICDGLGAAHQVGVVHRDLKPDNVIVVAMPDGGELVKLLDFGVAKLLNRDDEDVGFQTAAGSVIGTPAYMSPEQAGGMVIDARSDIYSLGAIMYELFTGQPMFRGRSFGEYVRKHLTEMPVPPHDTPGGAGIDPRLEALILRSLDKDPDLRFAHISELREALLHLLGGADALGDAGGSYPPGLPRLSASGQRPLSAPLAAMLPRAPTPAPASQSSQSSQVSQVSGVAVPQEAHPAHNSGPHSSFSSGPHRPPSSSGPHDPHGSGPHVASSSSPYSPHSSGPHVAPSSSPHGLPPSGPYSPHSAAPHVAPSSGPHSSFDSGPPDSPAPGPYNPHSSGPHAVNPAGISGQVQVAAAAAAYPPPLTLDGAYSLPPPLTLDGAYRLPAPPVTAASSTPWWAWFSIGALAIGVGIAAAIWYAGRNEPDLSPRPALTSRPDSAASGSTAPGSTASTTAPGSTAPGSTASTTARGSTAPSTAASTASAASPSGSTASASTPGTAAPPSAPPGPRPALVEVRFDSTPSGSVFAEGQAAELCRTPCAFDIDPADGGPADHRAFVVRRAGYVETPITVDLAGAQREFRVTLPRAEPGAAHPDARPHDARSDGKDTADRHTAKRPARPARKSGKDAAARTDAAPDARPDASPDPSGKPDARPATKKSVPPIDPTDTLDPFRKK